MTPDVRRNDVSPLFAVRPRIKDSRPTPDPLDFPRADAAKPVWPPSPMVHPAATPPRWQSGALPATAQCPATSRSDGPERQRRASALPRVQMRNTSCRAEFNTPRTAPRHDPDGHFLMLMTRISIYAILKTTAIRCRRGFPVFGSRSSLATTPKDPHQHNTPACSLAESNPAPTVTSPECPRQTLARSIQSP